MSELDDHINGTPEADFIDAGGGDDHVASGAGNDFVRGGDGDDHVASGDGFDVVIGGDGDDHVASGAGSDTVRADDGDDDIASGGGSDTVDGGDGDDKIDAGGGNDVLIGGEGDDFLNGGGGADIYRFNFTLGDTGGTGGGAGSGHGDPLIATSDGNDTIAQFQQAGPKLGDRIFLIGLEDLTAASLDLLFDLTTSDVDGDGNQDSVLSWVGDDEGSITILGSTWGSLGDFFEDDRVFLT